MVIWLIGKACAGKTSVGRAVHARLKRRLPNTVFLDGDELRAAVGEDLGYTVQERYVSERRTSRLCKLLADQGIHVVCAKLSNSPEMREWNRRNIQDYYDVYLRVDDSVLEASDVKGLYHGYRRGDVCNVVGMDIPFHEPVSPWMIVDNDRRVPCDQIAEAILDRIQRVIGSAPGARRTCRLLDELFSDEASASVRPVAAEQAG